MKLMKLTRHRVALTYIFSAHPADITSILSTVLRFHSKPPNLAEEPFFAELTEKLPEYFIICQKPVITIYQLSCLKFCFSDVQDTIFKIVSILKIQETPC